MVERPSQRAVSRKGRRGTASRGARTGFDCRGRSILFRKKQPASRPQLPPHDGSDFESVRTDRVRPLFDSILNGAYTTPVFPELTRDDILALLVAFSCKAAALSFLWWSSHGGDGHVPRRRGSARRPAAPAGALLPPFGALPPCLGARLCAALHRLDFAGESPLVATLPEPAPTRPAIPFVDRRREPRTRANLVGLQSSRPFPHLP